MCSGSAYQALGMQATAGRLLPPHGPGIQVQLPCGGQPCPAGHVPQEASVSDTAQISPKTTDDMRPLSFSMAAAQSMLGPVEPTAPDRLTVANGKVDGIDAPGIADQVSSAREQPSQQAGEAMPDGDRHSLPGTSQDTPAPAASAGGDSDGPPVCHKQQPGQAESASLSSLGSSSHGQQRKPSPTASWPGSASCLDSHRPGGKDKSDCAITGSRADVTRSEASAHPDVSAIWQQSASEASAEPCSSGAVQHIKSGAQQEQASQEVARALPHRHDEGSSGSVAQSEKSAQDALLSQDADFMGLLKPSHIQVTTHVKIMHLKVQSHQQHEQLALH